MIRFIVDSAVDITQEEAQQKGVVLLPLTVNIGGSEYRDGIDISRDEFYRLLDETGEFPQTSQVTPALYAEEFEKARSVGDEVISLSVSSKLSGTYESALIARSMVGEDGIYCVDTLAASYPFAMLLDHALALRDEGRSAEEIVEDLKTFRYRVRMIGALDTLENLMRGGRIPKAAARLGDLAKLKIVVVLDGEGEVGLKAAVLGRKRAHEAMLKHILSLDIDTSFPVYSLFTSGLKNCEKFESRLREVGISFQQRCQVGSAVGAHLGTQACGLAYVLR